ncbi:Alkaline phosphatase synthesis transcriptional regulatory protein SphR [subsurface metagenome]
MLERLGYTVIPANNGRTCLEMFMRDRDSIDLVILDLMLPVISGKEVLRKIRRIDKAVKIIILSGHGFENDRSAFADLRADDYLVKPFTVPEMAMAVRNVLDGRKIPEK